MRSPQKTDYHFNSEDNYALFMGCYVALIDPICKQYKLSPMELRILSTLSAIKQLLGWRSVGIGITPTQVGRMSGVTNDRAKYLLQRLRNSKLVNEEVTVQGKRRIYRYELTKVGKEIVNKITRPDKVNERILQHLLDKRLIK